MSSKVCKDVHNKESLLCFSRLFSISFVHLHFSEVARGCFFFLLACPPFLYSFDLILINLFIVCPYLSARQRKKSMGIQAKNVLCSYFTVQYSMNLVHAPFCPSTIWTFADVHWLLYVLRSFLSFDHFAWRRFGTRQTGVAPKWPGDLLASSKMSRSLLSRALVSGSR